MSNPSSSCGADGGIVEVKQSALLPFGIRRRIVLLWRQKMRVSKFIRIIQTNLFCQREYFIILLVESTIHQSFNFYPSIPPFIAKITNILLLKWIELRIDTKLTDKNFVENEKSKTMMRIQSNAPESIKHSFHLPNQNPNDIILCNVQLIIRMGR